MKKKKLKSFRNTTEVRRQARLRVGSPPAAVRHTEKKDKPAKHKKLEKLAIIDEV